MRIVNIIELAKKLNLSITTVSRALGGYSDVSEVTRKRVMDFAKKHNYNPNPYASNLASHKSNAVGFVIPLYGLNNNTLNQISYFKFVAGMSTKINQDNILFYMLFANSAKEEMESYKKLVEVNKVKNIIIHNVQTDDKRIEYLNSKNINFVGFIDVIIRDEIRDRLKIIDIKTSTMGWNKWAKADKNKSNQLLLYKQFYSKQFNFPIDKIDIEFFIVKRKLYENLDFPQRRIQTFVPASGTPSINKVNTSLKEFIDECFDEEGKHNEQHIFKKIVSTKNCKYCEFKDKPELCDRKAN